MTWVLSFVARLFSTNESIESDCNSKPSVTAIIQKIIHDKKSNINDIKQILEA